MDLTTIAQDVLALIAAEGVCLSDDLTQAEQIVRDMMLSIGARAVELHLSKQSLGYEGSSRPCEGCHHNQRFVDHRPRTLATLLGQVTIRRAYYHCPQCGSSCCPYDQKVGLGTGQASVGLAKAATLLASMDPFVPAATLLADLTGQRLGDRTIHRIARKAGAVAAQQEREAAQRHETQTENSNTAASPPPIEVEATPATLYVAVDGVMVHRDQWNEAKCVTCYWEEADGNGGTKRQGRYAARFESAQEFAPFAVALAMCCGLSTALRVVLLGDGAAWIWDHVAKALCRRTSCGTEMVCITDWFHVMEHVWACGNTLLGQGTDRARDWVEECKTLLWEGHWRQLLKRLEQEHGQTRSPPKRQALTELRIYLQNQGERLAYDRFRTAGLDIGSGRVESACKHVVATRMKRSGMIWSDQGAQDLLSLRTAYLNGWWDELWATHPLRAKAA